MTTVQITSQIQIELSQLLSGVEQLSTDELEQFATQVNLILAQRKASSSSAQEAELLKKISQLPPLETQQRYEGLQAKLQTETITPDEHQELLHLIDVVEQANVERLQYLAELSQLRQLTLPELIAQLGIRPALIYV